MHIYFLTILGEGRNGSGKLIFSEDCRRGKLVLSNRTVTLLAAGVVLLSTDCRRGGAHLYPRFASVLAARVFGS